MAIVKMWECDGPTCKELGIPEEGPRNSIRPPYGWISMFVDVIGQGIYDRNSGDGEPIGGKQLGFHTVSCAHRLLDKYFPPPAS